MFVGQSHHLLDATAIDRGVEHLKLRYVGTLFRLFLRTCLFRCEALTQQDNGEDHANYT